MRENDTDNDGQFISFLYSQDREDWWNQKELRGMWGVEADWRGEVVCGTAYVEVGGGEKIFWEGDVLEHRPRGRKSFIGGKMEKYVFKHLKLD